MTRRELATGTGVIVVIVVAWAVAHRIPSLVLGPGPEDAPILSPPTGWDTLGLRLERDSLARIVTACSTSVDSAGQDMFRRIVGRKPER